jgi:hypothetical protein
LITEYSVQEKKQRQKKGLTDGEISSATGPATDDKLKATPGQKAPTADVCEPVVKAAVNDADEDDAQLVLAEEAAQSKVGWTLLKAYFKSA